MDHRVPGSEDEACPGGHPLDAAIADRAAANQAGDPMANLCVLATVDAEGRPHARVVVLRALEREGVEVVFSALSPKWDQLQATGEYELLLYWGTSLRQYRLRGDVDVRPPDERRRDWARKRPTSKHLDHLYTLERPQSAPVESRAALLASLDAVAARFPDPAQTPLPEALRLIRFVPHRVEVWHGSEADRVHRRWEVLRAGAGWDWRLLVP